MGDVNNQNSNNFPVMHISTNHFFQIVEHFSEVDEHG